MKNFAKHDVLQAYIPTFFPKVLTYTVTSLTKGVCTLACLELSETIKVSANAILNAVKIGRQYSFLGFKFKLYYLGDPITQ